LYACDAFVAQRFIAAYVGIRKFSIAFQQHPNAQKKEANSNN
jgi:hypothetical protein